MAALYPFLSTMFPYRPPSDRPFSAEIELTTFLPEDLSELFQSHIFVHLSPTQLANASMVSKAWKMAANSPGLWEKFDLKQLFPLKMCGEAEWDEYIDLEKFHLSFEGVGPLDKRLAIPQIVNFFADLKKNNMDVPLGATLLTIPKGFSVALLGEILGCLKKGKAKLFEPSEDVKRLFPKEIARTYRILITNACLPGTEEWDDEDKWSFVRRMGCRVPRLLEVKIVQQMLFLIFPALDCYDPPTLCSEVLRNWAGPIAVIAGVDKKGKRGVAAVRDIKC